MKYRKYEGHKYIRKSTYVHRHPKTLQEMKWADKYTRPKRRNLPTSWDDKIASRLIVTSWKDKSKKKKQWQK